MVEFLVDLHLLDGTLQSEANVLPEKRMDKALIYIPPLWTNMGSPVPKPTLLLTGIVTIRKNWKGFINVLSMNY